MRQYWNSPTALTGSKSADVEQLHLTPEDFLAAFERIGTVERGSIE